MQKDPSGQGVCLNCSEASAVTFKRNLMCGRFAMIPGR